PDRCPGDVEAEARFKEAAEAYEVLNDPEKRRLYDQYGHEGLNRAGFGGGFQDFGDIFSAFGGIFQDLFSTAGQSPNRPRRGRDMAYEAVIEFTAAFTGTPLEIKIPREENCPACDGSGSRTKRRAPCRECGGTGQIYQGRGFIRMASTCPACRGAGTYAADPCGDCQGRGRIKRTRTMSVKIPAGVDTGSRLRLSGEGEAGWNGGPPGDLYVEIIVRHHEFFSREHNHVLLERKIDMVAAALGAEIEVPTVTGETRTLMIPAGIQNGKLMRLPGLGFKNPSGGVPGDLIVSFSVEIPVDLTERQEELLREFAALEAEKKGESTLSRLAKKARRKLKGALA
ncbi:MAG: molecular chaperone DnaJ, partial [Candidatus Adiutrix sp.]|nr:molecular chaperone DnaJ [Candidatus Adiutrix sp.]